MPKRRFKPTEYRIRGGDRTGAVLGPLEADVMEVAWRFGSRPFTVRQVYEALKEGRDIAYTTVMTTMNALFEKRLLDRGIERGKGGLLYIYRTAMSRDDLEKQTIRDILRSLWKNFGKEALTSSFFSEVKIEPEELKKLLEEGSDHPDQDSTGGT